MLFATWILFCILQTISGKLYEVEDKNEMKKLLNSHSNILVSFIENDKVEILTLLQDLAVKGNKLAKVLTINCKLNKKLCKQYKATDFKNFVIHHFHKGKFNKVYDRKVKIESLLRFLEDPTGDIAWEEDENAKDVFHAKSSQDLQKMMSKFKNNIPQMMLMFYAPWCNFCRQMKPEFAAAATILKGKTIFIGINGDLPSTDDLKQAFNITGYPSVFLIKDGSKVYKFENENSRDALVKFVHEPTKTQPPPTKDVPWSEETTEIDFLTDSNFNNFVQDHESVLVMFYAPWCGHCKSMKPEIIEASNQLKKLNIEGKIAAIDATENRNVSDTFQIKGFPTLKYFKFGQFMFDVNERSSDGLVKFMKDPQKPVEPVPELPWNEENSFVLHPKSGEFKGLLKRFKHSLVMFYAPWCGHCKATKPMFSSAANRMQGNGKVAFVAVDCTEASFSGLCSSEGVTGFPTFRYFNYGKNTSHSEYTLERSEDDFVAFMTNPENPKLDPRRHWRRIPGHEAIVILSSESFQPNITAYSSGTLIMFYSPWCRHCIAMKPAYAKAAQTLRESLPSCLLGAVDITVEPGLASQYHIQTFPTLLYFQTKDKWIKYEGKRLEDDIVQFMIQKDAGLRKKAEEEKEQARQQAERKRKQEEERKENERKEAERKRQEIKEQKKKEEIERQKAEEEKKEQQRKEAEKREIEERKRQEAEKREIEERKRQEAEKREIEERKRQEVEKEMKRKEEIDRKKEEEKRKKVEEEERKRLEKEKKEIEDRKKKEIEKKKMEEQKRENEEKERNERVKEEEKRKIEEQKRKEIERLKAEQEKEQDKRKSEERKIGKDDPKESLTLDADGNISSDKGHKENEGWGVQFLTIIDKKSFYEHSMSSGISLFYFHKSNRKPSVRNKLVKLLDRMKSVVSSYEVDCSMASDLCDELTLINTPVVLAYRNGKKLGSLVDNWSEESFNQLLEHSIREEL